MDWARMLAYITGTVDQELLLRNEYLAVENRILKAQVKGRLLLSDAEKKTLAEVAHRLGRKALEDVANAAKPDTILGWYRKLIARKFDGSTEDYDRPVSHRSQTHPRANSPLRTRPEKGTGSRLRWRRLREAVFAGTALHADGRRRRCPGFIRLV